MMNNQRLQEGSIIESRFKLLKIIGQGSFGVVYSAFDLENNEYCACKVEVRKVKPSVMTREIAIMNELSEIAGFPQIIHHNKDKNYIYMMFQMLGDNLENLLRRAGGRFSVTTVLQIGLQLIDRIEVLHSKNLIHRDIKPENIMISREDNTLLYLIDFGLSKYYRQKDGRHIDYQQKQGVIGTARYSSTNALQWMEQSRRDDLESIGYILIYLAKGELPWQNIKAPNKEAKYEAILEMKMSNSLNSLCAGLPKCLIQYFQHIKSLLFTQQPNYSLLRQQFQNQLDQLIAISPLYDWETQQVEDLPDPNSIPDIEYVQVFAKSQVIDEDAGQVNGLQKMLPLPLLKVTSVENHSQATSKMQNYQPSQNKIESAPQLLQIPRRKDSKSYTVLQTKENRSKGPSNESFEIPVDDDANLKFNHLQIKYS